jgi:hypothetical protein
MYTYEIGLGALTLQRLQEKKRKREKSRANTYFKNEFLFHTITQRFKLSKYMSKNSFVKTTNPFLR